MTRFIKYYAPDGCDCCSSEPITTTLPPTTLRRNTFTIINATSYSAPFDISLLRSDLQPYVEDDVTVSGQDNVYKYTSNGVVSSIKVEHLDDVAVTIDVIVEGSPFYKVSKKVGLDEIDNIWAYSDITIILTDGIESPSTTIPPTTTAPIEPTTTTIPPSTTTTKAPRVDFSTTTTLVPCHIIKDVVVSPSLSEPSITTTTTTIPPTTSTTTIPVCADCAPLGYISVGNGTACEKSAVLPATAPTSPGTLVRKVFGTWGLYGMYIYNKYAIDGRARNNSNTAYSMADGMQVRGNPWWRNGDGFGVGTSTSQGPMNRTAIWSNSESDSQEVGFSYCFTTATATTYYIGVGSDNYSIIKLDGTTLVNQGLDLYNLDIDHSGVPDNTQSAFYVWHVYPVQLTAGFHIIEVTGHNIDLAAGFGVQIYNNTASEIASATSDADLDVIFDSASREGDPVEIGNFGQGYTCPDGYSLDLCSGAPSCRYQDTFPCGGSPSPTTTTTLPPMKSIQIDVDDGTGNTTNVYYFSYKDVGGNIITEQINNEDVLTVCARGGVITPTFAPSGGYNLTDLGTC